VSTTKRERPLSPHLQVYRPQLTSVLSIIHRGTGVALALGAFGVAWWLHRIAGDGGRYDTFHGQLTSLPGQIVLAGFSFALLYHLLNGIRHLGWDMGWGLEIKRTYQTGWAVVVCSLLATAGLWLLVRNGGVA
jgi:succinate dehydrogenase / fumarate reductase cytochrome b subunit